MTEDLEGFGEEVGMVAKTRRMRWKGLRTGWMDKTVSLELAAVRFGGEGIPIPVRVEGAGWGGKGGGRDRSE